MAINDYPFMKTNYLKTYAMPIIEKNVDDNKLVPYIYNAQSRYLMPILGSTFFEHLRSAGLADTLTSDEEFLIDNYIKQVVLHYTVMTLLEDGASIVSNKGVLERNSTFANPMTQADISNKVKSVRHRAQDFRYRLVKYLCDNESLFPELDSSTIQNVYRSYKTYSFPIHFGPGYDNEKFGYRSYY